MSEPVTEPTPTEQTSAPDPAPGPAPTPTLQEDPTIAPTEQNSVMPSVTKSPPAEATEQIAVVDHVEHDEVSQAKQAYDDLQEKCRRIFRKAVEKKKMVAKQEDEARAWMAQDEATFQHLDLIVCMYETSSGNVIPVVKYLILHNIITAVEGNHLAVQKKKGKIVSLKDLITLRWRLPTTTSAKPEPKPQA